MESQLVPATRLREAGAIPVSEARRGGPTPAVWARRTVLGQVRLDVTKPAVPGVLDQLAEAYAEDPEGIGGLLEDLAQALAHRRSRESEDRRRDLPPCVLEHAHHAVDAARDALVLAALGEDVEHEMRPSEARALALQIAHAAEPFHGAYTAGGAA
jgi:hypothetical protein